MNEENELKSVLTQLREFYMNPPEASKMLRVFVIIDRLNFYLWKEQRDKQENSGLILAAYWKIRVLSSFLLKNKFKKDYYFVATFYYSHTILCN